MKIMTEKKLVFHFFLPELFVCDMLLCFVYIFRTTERTRRDFCLIIMCIFDIIQKELVGIIVFENAFKVLPKKN